MLPAMKKDRIVAVLATALTLGPSAPSHGQGDDGERKVRIEITTNEDGRTQHVTREFDLNDGDALEDALRELGVFDEIGVINDGENLVIDLKRSNEEGGVLKDMSVALANDEDDGRDGAYLGIYGGNWNASTCEADLKKDKNNKAVKEGACITHVIEGTPADRAGLKEGDVVTRIDGTPIGSFGDLSETVSAHHPGDRVNVTYWRDGKKSQTDVELGAREDDDDFSFRFDMPDASDWSSALGAWSMEPRPFLGVDGEDLESEGGVRITTVVEGSSAEAMGIKEGDVITMFNGVKVLGFDELAEMIGDQEPGSEVSVNVERNGSEQVLTGTLGQQETPTWAMPETPEIPEVPNPQGAPAPYVYPLPGIVHNSEREEMRREMEAMRRDMDQLRRELRGGVQREMRVVIGTVELSKEETDVLKNKGVTGLEAGMELPELRCYPNPSEGSFHLSFTVAERGDLNVDVHDANGERVYHETITGFKGHYERMLDLSDLSDGNYFLVIGQNGRTLARKLVKQ